VAAIQLVQLVMPLPPLHGPAASHCRWRRFLFYPHVALLNVSIDSRGRRHYAMHKHPKQKALKIKA
jgi:hypothetical protein